LRRGGFGVFSVAGESSEAIEFLLEARPRLRGEDRVGADQALVLSYLQAGRKSDAVAIAEEGVRQGGRFGDIYRRLREEIRR